MTEYTVRRGDKLANDAIRHDIDEYMRHAEGYFMRLEEGASEVSRKVYLATDDSRVITEIKEK